MRLSLCIGYGSAYILLGFGAVVMLVGRQSYENPPLLLLPRNLRFW
ncbi:hypothetical protein RUMCAL_01382 [Ruminococcus callidus ATCC 27760]|uniref:Uncharacterized protein n=1 Tax=Ruminococcus callidus ATCC 27760 TaxID=411473 RepID=U2KVC7_9FIRM|nr:hypothetical protein RUMCAL_01382 [Ruminococcus callidus ATCC 27760]